MGGDRGDRARRRGEEGGGQAPGRPRLRPARPREGRDRRGVPPARGAGALARAHGDARDLRLRRRGGAVKGPVVENTPLFFQPAANFVTPEGAEALNFAGFEAAASAVNEGIMYPVLELLNKLGFSEMQNIL